MKKAALKKRESFFEKKEDNLIDVIQDEEKIINSRLSLLFKRPVKIGGLILIILILIGVVVGYGIIKKNGALTPQGGKLTASQVSELIAEVGEKMIIPKGETPTIATVTDITKLQSQPFFRNAVNGDKVMIFGSTNTAILYRPSIHKIVTVAPINAQNSPVATNVSPSTSIVTGAVTPTPTQAEEALKVVILNSTKTIGLAKKAADLLDSNNVDVTTSNAKGEYEKTTVSSVSKDKKVGDAQLKALVSGFTKIKPVISNLPPDEAVTAGADVVIILGADFSEAY